MNNESRIYIEARKLLLLNFDIVGIVELRDKTFKPTNTTTAGLFLRKRENKRIVSAVKAILENIKNGELDFLNDLEFKFPTYNFNADVIKKHLKEIKLSSTIIGIGLSIEVILSIVSEINKDKRTVLGYSGEKKEQEQFLGYRFSKIRSKESLELLEDRLLYNENDLFDSGKVNSHILANFNDVELPIPKKLEKHVGYIAANAILEKENLVINNPSQYFESDNYVIETNSPLGDFIDEYEQVEISLNKLISNGDIEYLGGIIYNKKSEVPYPTDRKVITASNMDLKTGKLIFGDKIIHLNNDLELPQEIKPKKNDIIISNSSGSLKHLGKVVFVDKDYDDAVIGGFLSIIRCKDEKIAKVIFYRMLSLPFRKYVSSLRGQNINNMDLDKLKAFKFEIPKDVISFYKKATSKEKQWEDIIEKMSELKN
ncbi:MAG: hypothetical protein ACTHNG_13455 [Ginsengibacter sp.]